MYSGVERTTTSATRPSTRPEPAGEAARNDRERGEREDARRDERDLRQHQGLRDAGQRPPGRGSAAATPRRPPGRQQSEVVRRARARDDIVARGSAPDWSSADAAADRLREQQDARRGSGTAASPAAPRSGAYRSARRRAQQRRGLRVVALLEVGIRGGSRSSAARRSRAPGSSACRIRGGRACRS